MMGTAGLGMGALGSAAADDDHDEKCPPKKDAKDDERDEKKPPEEKEPEEPDEVENGIEIGECTTISESGDYVLTQDLETPDGEACIVIEADDVILDGAGNSISNASIAVLVNSDNVTVQNLTVANSGTGVNLQNSTGSIVTENTVTDNGTGILLSGASENVVSDNVVTNNAGNGIILLGSDENEIVDNETSNNGENGIFINGLNNIITGNTAQNNGNADITVLSTVADDNIFEDNILTDGGPGVGAGS